MERYYLLNTMGDNRGDLCIVEGFVDGALDKGYMVVMGERMGDSFPKNAVLRMTPHREGIRLAPLLGNLEGMIIVSTGVRRIIEKHAGKDDVEYLPFTLLDPRGRVHSRDYTIVNPLMHLDCLDHGKSGTKFVSKDPSMIAGVKQHVIDPKKVAGAPQLFRMKGIHGRYLIGVELAEELRPIDNIFWKKLPFSNEV